MRRAARGRWTAAVLVAIAIVAAGCGGGSNTGASDVTDVTTANDGPVHEGGQLVVGLGAETSGWNPVNAVWLSQGLQVASAIFDPLTAFDAEGNVRPYLAESIESNEDFTEWTVGLRPEVLFHDGTPVDAEAVRENLEAHRASLLTGQAFGPIEAVEAVDPLTVLVRMNEPWSTFPGYLTAQPGYVAAPSMLVDPDANLNPVGSGPFVFEEWQPDAKLTVRANDDYWQEGLPILDGIEFQILPDDATRTESLKSGDVDMIDITLPEEILKAQAAADDGELQMFIDEAGDSDEIGLALNTAQPPFDDPIAREIVAVGINNQLMSDTVFQGVFEPARGSLRPESEYFVETDYPTYDPAKAQELADEYEENHGEPLSFTLKAPPDPAVLEIVQLAQQLLGEFGVEVIVETPEQTTLVVDGTVGNFEAIGYILFSSPDLDGEYALLHSSNAKPLGEIAINITRMENPKIDAAFEALRRSDDIEVRQQQSAVVQKEMATDLAWLFTVHTVGAIAARNEVRDATTWTLPDGEPGIPQRGTVVNVAQIWLDQ